MTIRRVLSEKKTGTKFEKFNNQQNSERQTEVQDRW